MAILTPLQVYQLIAAEDIKRGGDNKQGRLLMTGIVLRESGGNTAIVNTAGNDPPGSRDRGLFQWNDHWNPDVSDMEAFDPQLATAIAWEKSNGYKNFQPWLGGNANAGEWWSPVIISPKGTDAYDRQNDALKQAINAAKDYGDAGDVGITDIPSIAAGAVDDLPVIGTVLSWTEALGNILSKLMDPNFWKRVGIGLLGVTIIVVALIIIFKDQAVEAAVPGPEINAS